MRVIRPLLLWIVLTFFFSLLNHSYEPSEVLIQAINSALFATGFYFSYSFLVLPLLYSRKVLRFSIFYFLTILLLSAVSMVSIYEVYVYENNKFFVDSYWSDPVFFTSNFMLILLATSTLLSVRVIRDKMRTQLQLENLEKEKITAELDFLKAQINPHFLFNSLNNILFQIDKTNHTARETLLKFSEMLRYQLYECNADLVTVEKEIQYIRNYIEIQSMRKSDRYRCHLTVSDSVKKILLAPLLLIPFIENAFKHISHHPSRENTIRIGLDYRKEELIFTVVNDKDDSAKTEVNENKGIGLANVKRRLDLLYPGQHSLEVGATETEFSIRLTMKVQNVG